LQRPLESAVPLTDVRRRIDARYDPDDDGGGIDRIFRDSSDELDDERGE
jgi:hypothetical protein